MATNASKFTGVQSDARMSDGIDIEQLRKDAQEMIQEGATTPALVRFAQKNRAAVLNATEHIKAHPTMAKLLGAAVIGGSMAAPVAADTSAFGMNATVMDAAFDVLNEHIIPKIGETIAAFPAIIIPFIILVVFVMIMLFVPELLYQFLDMLKDAAKIKK